MNLLAFALKETSVKEATIHAKRPDHIIFIAQETIGSLQTVFMNLQEKTIAVLVASLIAVIIIITVFVSVILISSYTTLETRYMEKDLTLEHSELANETGILSTRVTEWAPWDDTYAFAMGKLPGYVAENLIPDTYSNINVNVIVIANRQGDILYAGAYDLHNMTMMPVPDTVLALTDPKNPIMNINNPKGAVTGILRTSGSPIFIAARPIVHTDYSGNPEGVVIMGKYLDDTEIQRLSTRSLSTLRMIRIDDPSLSPDILARLRAGDGSRSDIIQPLENNLIGGYTLVRDINGQDAFVLELVQPRDIYQQGLATIQQFIFIVLAACALFGIAMLVFLDRFVLSRIGAISLQVHAIGRDLSVSQRVKVPGDDELSGLALEINGMLEKIDKTRNALQQSEVRFRELAERAPLDLL